jgi:hypothetical protein
MASGFTSNYNDSGYTFTVNNDGMMLASLIRDPSSNTALTTTNNLNGCINTIYTSPGTANTVPGTFYQGMQYGTFPTSSFMARSGTTRSTITVNKSDIYNFANPGVFHLTYTNNSSTITPILGSTAFLGFYTVVDRETGFIVYPGWGIRVFNGPSTWDSTFTSGQIASISWTRISYTYFNDTNAPVLFTSANNDGDNSKMYGVQSGSGRTMPPGTITIPIMIQATTTNTVANRSMADFSSNGIQIFFRSGNPLYLFGQTT